jgi:LmeA-like phospholipid-binding
MRRGGNRRRYTRIGLSVTGAVLVALLLAQLLLPRIAASRISSRVGRYGGVQSVSVSAWPAVKMLWGSVDSVRVRAKRLSLSPAQAAKLLWEARGVDRLDVTAPSVLVGPLRLSDARLRKRGRALSAEARTGEADVRAALPEGLEVRLLRSERGQVAVQASGGLFGVGTSVEAVALASEGKLVAHPVGALLEGLQLTLFSDRHVYVQAVGASEEAGQPASYRLSMRASLR